MAAVVNDDGGLFAIQVADLGGSGIAYRVNTILGIIR